MRSFSAIAFSALLLNFVTAAPVIEKRNVVWHTVVEEVVKTVDVYTTIWIEPAAPTPAPTTSVAQPKPTTSVAQPKPTTSAKVSSPAAVPSAPAPAHTLVVATSTSAPAPPLALPTVKAVASPPPQEFHAAPAPAPVASSAPAAQPSSVSKPSSSSGGLSVLKSFTNPLPGATVKDDCAGGCTGDMTFYNPSQGMGACGGKHGSTTAIWEDTDDVVAVAVNMMGSLSSGDVMNPFCNQMIKITNPHNGKTATGRVVDKCAGCPGNSDIDLSPALYDQLADAGAGRIHDVQWSWA